MRIAAALFLSKLFMRFIVSEGQPGETSPGLLFLKKTTFNMDTNVDIFRRWFLNVRKGNPSPGECTPANVAEVAHLYQCAVAATNDLMASGTRCRISGKGNPKRNGFTFQAGQAKFTVHPVAAAAKKGVALTSRMAYAALDKETQAYRVAEAVVSLHTRYPFVSDNQVAEAVNIPAARVSARRTELEKAGRVVIDGIEYCFEQCQDKIKCPITGKTVQGWRLAVPEAKKEGVQIAMF